jgi:hypothetical protein
VIQGFGEEVLFPQWLDFILAVATAFGSLVGSAWVIRAVVKHEEKVCDSRMEAFKEGLDRHEEDS